MRRWVLLAAIFLVAAMAHACSCMGPGPVCSIDLGTAAAIFRGTVIERTLIRPPSTPYKRPDGSVGYVLSGGRYRVRFAVQETFSGAPGQEATVYTNEQSSMCGFNFEEGAEYVVFTYNNTADNELWTSHCSRTAKLTPGVENESVTWMRSRAKALPGSEIFGSMLLPRGSPQSMVPSRVSLGGPVQRAAIPDDSGKYSFKGLPAGEYKASAMVPIGFVTQPIQSVKLGAKGCAEVDWRVSYEGKVRGRVVDVDGRPVADLTMTLERAEPDDNGRRSSQRAVTELDGTYEFELVSPGDYVVKPESPVSLTEYPGQTPVQFAQPVTLGASATLDGANFALPRLRPTLPVRVKVVDAGGYPVPAGAMVFAYENGSSQPAPTRTGVTDSEGWVTLPLLRGRVYSLRVARDRSHPMCSGELRLTAQDGGDLGPLKISNPEACLR